MPNIFDAIIKKDKIEVKKLIGDYASSNAKSHITINNFPRKAKYVDRDGLLSLGRRANLLPPVSLSIDGYDFFENGEIFTIYAKIKWDHQTAKWFGKLWKIVGKCSDKPHVTVARSIDRVQFEKVWPYFKDRELRKLVRITKLTILEVLGSNKVPSKIFCEFEFKGAHASLELPVFGKIETSVVKSHNQIRLF